MKILFFANTDWYLYNYRLPLARTLRQNGYNVIMISPNGDYGKLLIADGFTWLPFHFSRRGLNPFLEIYTIFRLIDVYRKTKPDIVHHFTSKCVLYGSIAAKITGVKNIVNAITGLGFVFIHQNILAKIMQGTIKRFYRIALKNTEVIFQNASDLKFFIQDGIVQKEKAQLISGSGVDTVNFVPTIEPNGVPLVVLPTRMLWDKGVGEFVSAAKLIKSKKNVRFVLVGDTDPGNPAAIPLSQLKTWQEEGKVEWWGWCTNMREVYQQAHIVCMPSYYKEGLSKSLLEAAACGLPLVTTDIPGCREVVQNGINGYLVPAKNPLKLAAAIEKLIKDPKLRHKMGKESRRLVIENYSTEIINSKTIKTYNKIIKMNER